MLATLIQQWARRYDRITHPLGSAHKRARIRLYIFSSDENLHFVLATDLVPTLLHLSVFLFFAGLLIFLQHISHTVFNAVVGWVVLCVVVYAYITFLPIYKPSSPHYAPVSSLAWQVYVDILYPLFEFLSPVKRVHRPAPRLLKRLEEKAEEIVWGKSPKLDAVILESLLVTLGEGGTGEKFFEALPGFYNSQVVHVQDVIQNFSPTFSSKFRSAVNQFLDQTLSSDSVSELVRSRRLLTCLNATQNVLGEVACMSIAHKIIRKGNWNEMPPSPEIGHILRRWLNTTGLSRALIASCIISRIIVTAEKRDDTWMALAKSQLGVTEEVLRGYLEHGDSVLLANLIKTTRLFFERGLQFEGILRSISEFNVKETLPELQHDFCELWNEMVAVEKRWRHVDCTFILGEICHVHDALHPSAPTTIAAIPTFTTANDDSLFIGPSYAFCLEAQDPQSYHPHHPPDESRQNTAVTTSPSSSPLGVQSYLPPLQHDETKINPRLALDTPGPSSLVPSSPLREPPVGIQTAISPPLEHFYSTTTSHTHATPQDVSVLDPGIIVVTGDHDVQDPNAHYPHQSDPPAHDIL
jgi:Family of unknown function (DUF6535)